MQTQHPHRATRPERSNGIVLNLFASALTILTTIALLGAVTIAGDSSLVGVDFKRNAFEMHGFYRAVNEVLRSGDASALDDLVSPNLVFHTPVPQLTPDRAGLEHYLLSIRDTFPGYRLRVKDLVSDENQVLAQVIGSSATPGSFLGLPLAAEPSLWGTFDRFRIAGDKVVEMWSGAAAPVLFEPAVTVPLDLETPPQAISLEQLTASAGENRDWGSLSDSRLLYVDEGLLNLDLKPTASPPVLSTQRNGQLQRTAVTPRAHLILTAGDVLTVSPGGLRQVWHDAADSGVVGYTIALPRALYTGPLQPQQPSAANATGAERPTLGAIQADLEADLVLDPRAGVTIALGRAHLAPGGMIRFQATEGSALVVIKHGSLVLIDRDGVHSLESRYGVGQKVVTRDEPFALHNLGDSPISVLMVTMVSRGTPVTPAQ